MRDKKKLEKRCLLLLSIFFNMIIQFFIAMPFFCCTPKDYNHQIKDNDHASEWINRVKIDPSTITHTFTEEIPFLMIPDEQKDEYVTRLNQVQFVELKKDEYLKLAKKTLEKKYGFAIRTVRTHLGGNFEMLKNDDNEYYVHYWVMGSRVWEYNKAVLIIEADELPKEIFNGYTVVK